MKLQIIPSDEAEFQIAELGAWWRRNRTSAPNLFRDNLRKTFATLAESPLIGTPYECEGVPGLRRILVRKTPYHVYYVPALEGGKLYVVAVWSGMLAEGPPLRRP